MAAQYAMELIDVIMPAEEPSRKIYQLLLDYLVALETIRDIDKLVHVFQVKILLLSGFRPHIDACVKCQKRSTGRRISAFVPAGWCAFNARPRKAF